MSAVAAPDSYLLSHLRGDGRPATLEEHLRQLGPLPRIDLAAVLDESGLRGRGGGAFPAGRKLRAVAAGRAPAAVVANGAEGEPASIKDKALLRLLPHIVLDGAVAAARATRAPEVIVAVGAGAGRELDAVAAAIRERARASHDDIPIELVPIPAGSSPAKRRRSFRPCAAGRRCRRRSRLTPSNAACATGRRSFRTSRPWPGWG